MATQTLLDGQSLKEERQLEMDSASTSCDGLGNESRQSIPLMGDVYSFADPVNLVCATCIVYDRHEDHPIRGLRSGSDSMLFKKRQRAALIQEIEVEWCRIVGVKTDDDEFPYDENYVMRVWLGLRKMNHLYRQAWIRESKEVQPG